MLTKIGLLGWVLANVFASAAYVYFASWTWLEPNLRGIDVARSGDALVWMTGAGVVLAIASLANAVWFTLVSRERGRRDEVWPIRSILVVAAVWASVLIVDHFRTLGF